MHWEGVWAATLVTVGVIGLIAALFGFLLGVGWVANHRSRWPGALFVVGLLAALWLVVYLSAIRSDQ